MNFKSWSLSAVSIIVGLVMPYTDSFAQSESAAHPLLDSRFTIDAGRFFQESDFDITVKG